MPDTYLTDEEFLGSAAPAAPPSASIVGPTVSGDGLTLGHLDAPPPAAASVPASSTPTASAAPPSPKYMSDEEFLGPNYAYAPSPQPSAPRYMTDEEFLGPSSPNPSGPLANSDNDGWLSGFAKGLGTAAIKGLSNSVGMVGNLSNFADYLTARGESAVTGKPVSDIYADIQSQRAKEEAESPILSHFADPRAALPSGPQVAAPILAKTGEYQPTSGVGKAAQAGAEAAFGMIGPGGGTTAPETAGVQALIKTPLAWAPANVAAGAAGQSVADYTGDPLLGLAAGNAGVGLGHIAANSVGSFARPFAEDLPGVGRFAAGTRDTMAGDQLRARATDPDAIDRALTPGPMQPGQQPNYSLVPGSQPTLGQLTNDMGIMQAEREAKTADNSAFNLREGQQNTAQLAALRGARPANADAMSAPEQFQAQIDGINQAQDAAIANLTSRAQDLASGLGPTMTPEDRGAAIRNGIETVRGEAKAAKNALYRAVDPDGDLNAVATPIRETGSAILSGIGPLAAAPRDEEASILSTASSLPDVMPFRDLMDFDQRVTTAMKQERMTAGESPVWGRLSRLKWAVQGAINNSVENRAAYEAQQAASAAPRDNIQHRLADNLDATIQAQEAAWGLRRGNVTSRVAEGSSGGSRPIPGIGTVNASSAGRTGNEGRGQFGPSARDQGISPSPLQPNIDGAAAARLGAAKAAHADYARTYKEGPVGQVLKTQGFKDNYTVPSSAVAGRAVVPGDRGYETLKSFLTAAKGDPQVIHAVQDHLTSKLAQDQKIDGTINPQGFAKWRQQYGPAIRAMDEASSGFSTRFKTAARATEEMMAAGLAKKAAVDSFNKSQAAKFLGKTNPIEVENQIGSVLSDNRGGPTKMRELISQAKKSPAALEGLRAAGIDWMMRTFSQGAEAPGTTEPLLSAARFVKFVRAHDATLAEIYSPEQMNAFHAVAADLERMNRPMTATRIKGSPNTAKDILPFRPPHESGHTGEVVGLIEFLRGIGEHLKEGSFGKAGLIAAGGLGGLKAIKAVQGLRQSGIDKVQDAVRDALLNPERAKYYLGKSSPKEAEGKYHALNRSLRRSLIMQPVLAMPQ